MNTLPQAQPTTVVATPLRARSTKNHIQRLKPLELMTLTGLIPFAQVCLWLSLGLRWVRRLRSSCRGRPISYSDLTIFLTMIIQRLWRKSNEGIVQYLYNY